MASSVNQHVKNAAKEKKKQKLKIVEKKVLDGRKPLEKVKFKMVRSEKGKGKGSPPEYYFTLKDSNKTTTLILQTLAFFKFPQTIKRKWKKKKIKLRRMRTLTIQLDEYIINFIPYVEKTKKEFSDNLPILIDDICTTIILAYEITFKIEIYSNIFSSVFIHIERNLQSYLNYDPSVFTDIDDSKHQTELSKRKIKESCKKRQEMTIVYHRKKKQRVQQKQKECDIVTDKVASLIEQL